MAAPLRVTLARPSMPSWNTASDHPRHHHLYPLLPGGPPDGRGRPPHPVQSDTSPPRAQALCQRSWISSSRGRRHAICLAGRRRAIPARPGQPPHYPPCWEQELLGWPMWNPPRLGWTIRCGPVGCRRLPARVTAALGGSRASGSPCTMPGLCPNAPAGCWSAPRPMTRCRPHSVAVARLEPQGRPHSAAPDARGVGGRRRPVGTHDHPAQVPSQIGRPLGPHQQPALREDFNHAA